MVNLTLERSLVAKTIPNSVIEELATLDEHQRRMLKCLEGDVDVAKKAVKPAFGIFPRRGHISFVILREDVKYSKDFKQAGVRESKLTIDREETITVETLKMLIRLVKHTKDVRFDELVCFQHYLREGIDAKCYGFRVALEAI